MSVLNIVLLRSQDATAVVYTEDASFNKHLPEPTTLLVAQDVLGWDEGWVSQPPRAVSA